MLSNFNSSYQYIFKQDKETDNDVFLCLDPDGETSVISNHNWCTATAGTFQNFWAFL